MNPPQHPTHIIGIGNKMYSEGLTARANQMRLSKGYAPNTASVHNFSMDGGTALMEAAGAVRTVTLGHSDTDLPMRVQTSAALGATPVILHGKDPRAIASLIRAFPDASHISDVDDPEEFDAALEMAPTTHMSPTVRDALESAGKPAVKLTKSQIAVAQLVHADGLSTKEAADELGVGEETIRSHIRGIRERYEAAGVNVSAAIRIWKALAADGYITVDTDL